MFFDVFWRYWTIRKLCLKTISVITVDVIGNTNISDISDDFDSRDQDRSHGR